MLESRNVLTGERPVIALQDEYPAGFIDPMHSHDYIQILYASAGVMSVKTRELSFVIPPQRALWLPAQVEHEVACRGSVSLRTLYLAEDFKVLELGCRVFEVSDFLKALLLETADFAPNYDLSGREGQIIDLLVQEIKRMPNAPYHAAMPQDWRLLKVCDAIIADPSDQRDIDEWANVAGMGRRTFTRAFKRETGMGLAVWRQQVRLMEALSLLSTGLSITEAAFDVGYESSSGFSAMFRRTFGVAPSMYMKQ